MERGRSYWTEQMVDFPLGFCNAVKVFFLNSLASPRKQKMDTWYRIGMHPSVLAQCRVYVLHGYLLTYPFLAKLVWLRKEIRRNPPFRNHLCPPLTWLPASKNLLSVVFISNGFCHLLFLVRAPPRILIMQPTLKNFFNCFILKWWW